MHTRTHSLALFEIWELGGKTDFAVTWWYSTYVPRWPQTKSGFSNTIHKTSVVGFSLGKIEETPRQPLANGRKREEA